MLIVFKLPLHREGNKTIFVMINIHINKYMFCYTFCINDILFLRTSTWSFVQLSQLIGSLHQENEPGKRPLLEIF